MRMPSWARRAEDEVLVAEVKALAVQIERLVGETKRLSDWATKHDGVHSELFRHVVLSMGNDSAKAAQELAKVIYTKAKAQLIDKLFKVALTAAGTAILAKIGMSSLQIGGFTLGGLLP